MIKNNVIIIAILSSMTILGVMCTDLYVPSLPHLTQAFHTDASLIKLTITTYTLGLAVAPLIFGPVSDAIGRRQSMHIAIMLALLGSILGMFAPTVTLLMVARFIQSLGFGGVVALFRVVSSDLFEGKQLAKVVSIVSLIISLGPAVAPILGGYLEAHFGWQSGFVFIASMASILGLIIFITIPETAKSLNPKAMQLPTMLHNYREILREKVFWRNMLAASVALSCIVIYAAVSPFILQNYYHLTPVQFGWSMSVIVLMAVVSRGLNLILLRKLSLDQAIRLGQGIMLFGSLLMLLLSLLGVYHIAALIIPAMMIILGASAVPPNVMVSVFTPFRHIRGSISALYGSFVMFGIFIGTLIASVSSNTTLVLAFILCCASLFGNLAIRWR